MEKGNTSPLVYITIVNYNGKEDTAACLDSIQHLDYKERHVLVVDNGSMDDSSSYLRQRFPWAEFLENRQNLGFAKGQNVGIRHALERGAEYILVLNNDTVVSPSLLTDLLDVVVPDRSIGIAGPKILYYYKKDKIWFAGGKVHLALGNTRNIGMNKRDSDAFNRVIEEDYQTGCAFLLRREIIDKVGTFDERYFAYWEDADLCLRVRKKGYKVVCVQRAKIWHKVSATTGGGLTPQKAYLKARSGVKFYKRFVPKSLYYTTVPVCALTYVIVSSLIQLCKGREELFRAYVRGFLDGRRDLQIDREKKPGGADHFITP